MHHVEMKAQKVKMVVKTKPQKRDKKQKTTKAIETEK